MKKLLLSWFFFSSLFLFLIASALVLPDMLGPMFGDTATRLKQTADSVTKEAVQAFEQLVP